jgi:TATA-box binding protein (TBP) (component of TFIID and TFIIIB)
MSTDIKQNELNYPKLEDIPVSTKTFIAMTNLTLDLRKLFEFLPITTYTVVPRKRGRKKKNLFPDPNKHVPDGSIVTMKYENKCKGVDLKQKKSHNKKKKSKWFRNSFTVVMMIEGKPINFKICQNGVFQVTGCKLDSQAEGCVTHIWNYVSKEEGEIFRFSKGTTLESIFIPAMRNIDFNLGFFVDREKLAHYMSVQTEFHSLLETSFGYTGVNIKIPLFQNITDLVLKKIKFVDDKYIESEMTYGEYLNLLPEKDRNKKLNKDRYTTFLVFQSGKIICSSVSEKYMKDAYEYFILIIKKCKDIIEEKLDI